MKIEQFRIDGFGKLRGLETGSLEKLVVVLGPNEAGKSTLFHFLTTALYGFQPASRDRNPHVPWDTDEAGGMVQVRLSDDRCAVIERRLRSAPKGLLRVAGEESDLRNQPVPWVSHVPRGVFRQVFAITLAELAGLDSETWLRIQDRVLGSMGASDLRGARGVAERLEQEAGEIWRPSRRGNQRLRQLRADTRALRERRSHALDRDRTIRTLVEERENELVRLREARTERQGHKVALEVTNRLLPVRRRLDRLEALREQGGAPEELRQLPRTLVDTVLRLRADLDRAKAGAARISREVDEVRTTSESCDDRQQAIVEAGPRLDMIITQALTASSEAESVPEFESELREVTGRLRAIESQTFDAEADERAIQALSALPITLLEDRISRLESAAAAGGPREETSSAARWSRNPVPIAFAVAAGVGLLTWGLSTSAPTAASLGGALAALGAAWAALTLRAAEGPTHETDPATALQAEIREMLSALPLRKEWTDTPTRALVRDLKQLQELHESRRGLDERIGSTTRRVDALLHDGNALAHEVGLPAYDAPHAMASELRGALKAAEEVRAVALSAGRDLGRLEAAGAEAGEEVRRIDGEVAALVGRVFELTGATDLDAVERVERRISAHAEADQLEQELLREHPDLDEVRARIVQAEAEGVEWSRGSDELAHLRGRIEELDETVEDGVGTVEALEQQIRHLRELETADTVDSALLDARDAEDALARERDRKWVMAQLIREADRRFREEHQPDLLRRASEHLRTLTEGRYTGLLIDETGGQARFQLVGPGLPKPIPLASPISTGTIEQAYLSLRLAIVDHLDDGAERLPLFVDEAFVNWDASRRDQGLDTLSRLSETRQIFAFTCHPGMAARLDAHGARVLELER
ncbi:MAG: AAA family ATPase [Gemmatimonadota bacterium]